MTIPAGQTSITVSVGNGVSDTFPYNFKITANTDLLVTTIDTDNVETVLDLGVDYTVAGVGNDSGGSITLTDGPLTDQWRIACEDNVPVSQETVYANQTSFFGIKHENSYDKNVRLIKRLFDALGRTFSLPTFVTGVSTVLPTPSAKKSNRWNDAADALEDFTAVETIDVGSSNLEAVKSGVVVTITDAIEQIVSGSGNIQISDDGNGTITISAVGMGGGDVTEAGDNNFTGENSHTGIERFSSTDARPVSNTPSEVIVKRQFIHLMKGDGSNDASGTILSVGGDNIIVSTGNAGTGAGVSYGEGNYKESVANIDVGQVGNVNRVKTAYANLAAISAAYTAWSISPSYGDKLYVTNQGWATYEPPVVTGLGGDAWVLVADPTTAIT